MPPVLAPALITIAIEAPIQIPPKRVQSNISSVIL